MKPKLEVKQRKEETEHVTLELLHALAISMRAACLQVHELRFTEDESIFLSTFALT